MNDLIKYLIVYPICTIIIVFNLWFTFWVLVGIIVYFVRDNKNNKL